MKMKRLPTKSRIEIITALPTVRDNAFKSSAELSPAVKKGRNPVNVVRAAVSIVPLHCSNDFNASSREGLLFLKREKTIRPLLIERPVFRIRAKKTGTERFTLNSLRKARVKM